MMNIFMKYRSINNTCISYIITLFKSKYFIQSFCINGLFTNLKEKSSVERIVGGLKMCIFFLFLITLTPFLWILNWHKNFQYYIFTFI